MNNPPNPDPVSEQSNSGTRSGLISYGIFGLAALVFALSLAGAGYWLASQPQGSGIEMIIPTTQPPAPVVVHVSGNVVTPGLYTLPPGSRVADAISEAGGLTSDGDPEWLNLAAVLVDGQKIIAFERGSIEAPVLDPVVPGRALIDLNRATIAQLESLTESGN
jgi:competence protein ComEA